MQSTAQRAGTVLAACCPRRLPGVAGGPDERSPLLQTDPSDPDKLEKGEAGKTPEPH